MTRAAAHDLDAAKRALKRAIDLREAVDAVFRGIAQNRRVDVKALARLNVFVADTFARARLAIEGGTLTLQASPVDPLDAVSTAVVRAAVDLLTSDAAKRIGRCADDTCAWLFLDTTRSGTRRWCDMKQCGNRNKVRRFRAT